MPLIFFRGSPLKKLSSYAQFWQIIAGMQLSNIRLSKNKNNSK